MKTNIKKILYIISGFSILTMEAVAGSCVLPHQSEAKLYETFDSQISGYVNSEFRDEAWGWFNFKKKYWDEGIGFYDQTNIQLPLARAYNAMYIMKEVSSEVSSSDGRYWYDWATDKIDDLRFGCKGPTDGGLTTLAVNHHANTALGGLLIDEYVKLYGELFYWKNVIERSATIVHETRHYDKGHDADDNCPMGGSCDSSWGYKGANTYEVTYLRDLACAQSNLITPMMHRSATDAGQATLTAYFEQTPNFFLVI